MLALAGELVAMFGNVISRSLFDTSLLWSLEVGELALVVMTFIGGAIAYPRNEHMALHAFIDRLPQRWHAAIDAFACWQVFAMAVVGGWLAWEMMLSRWDERTPYLGISAIWFAVPMICGHGAAGLFRGQARVAAAARALAVVTGVVLALRARRDAGAVVDARGRRRATMRCPRPSPSSRCNCCSACRSASCC